MRGAGVKGKLGITGPEEPAQNNGASGESGTRPATARRRVLLVEDEDMVRKVLTRMLTSRGFEVHATGCGSEALALCEREPEREFDLLVTDLMMPDGSGVAVARTLTEKLPQLRVLFVSGYTSADMEGWEPRHYRFLTKPFGSAELASTIEDLFTESESTWPPMVADLGQLR